MTAFDENDERITAFILGDDSLSAEDRTAVTELLEKNAEAQKFAEELRAAAELAGMELAAESFTALATANIETAVRKELAIATTNGVAEPSDTPAHSPGQAVKKKSWMLVAQWAVAAGLVVGAGFYFLPRINNELGVASATRKADSEAKAMLYQPPGLGTELKANAKDGYGRVFDEKASNERFGDGEKPAASREGRADDDRWKGSLNGPGVTSTRNNGAPESTPSKTATGDGEKKEWWKELHKAEQSATPIPDEPPIAYISPKAWDELSARRLNYREQDVTRSDSRAAATVTSPAKPEAERGGMVPGQQAQGRVAAAIPSHGGMPPGAKPAPTPTSGGERARPQRDLGADRLEAVSKSLEQRSGGVDSSKLSLEKKVAEAELSKRDMTVAYAEGLPAPDPGAGVKHGGVNKGDGKDSYHRFSLEAKPTDAPVAAVVAPLPANNPVELAKQPTGAAKEVEDLAFLHDGAEADRKETLLRQRLFNPAPRNFGLAREHNTEAYPVLKENDFLTVNAQNALSTFSTDVDTASYSLVRKFLNQNSLPPPGAVRLEEMVNYFRYNYQTPTGDTPFAANLEIAECPWNPQNRLARIALKGRVIDENKRPPSNLVFLIDVSGSMNEPNKLPLVKDGLKLLVDKLGENDHVGIAVYASGSGLVLDSTSGNKKSDIMYAIDNLQPSGSTNGAAGIDFAYNAAIKGFIKGGTNRVILCTDGDFNVGVSSDDELVKLITEKAKSGVFLSVLGFGEGNFKDAKMMGIANKGNGNYAYIDSIKEAQKVLVEQMSGTLVTIAKDVKIQVEFNPAKVGSYRLLGYEKRMLKAEDFKDDKKDAGEIGAGHTVTALYELTPPGMSTPAGKVDGLRFQKAGEVVKQVGEWEKAFCDVKLRYKQPDGEKGIEISFPAIDEGKKYTQASEDFRFAAAAASFSMILRDSPYKGNATLASVLELAQAAKGQDPGGYRAEFIKLIEKAKELGKK